MSLTDEEHKEINTDEATKSPGIGHNSEAMGIGPIDDEPKESEAQDVGGVAGARLKSFIERVERLEEEKAALGEDIKEVFAEAKGAGFCTKTIRKILKLRKIDLEKRREADEMLNLYMSAIGMQYTMDV